jgi:hypothetical protein
MIKNTTSEESYLMIILKKCRFLCHPKTGSETVTAALLRACDVQEIIGADNPADYHATADDHRGEHLPSFAFVRHPLSWYPSYWNHRQCHGWRTQVMFRAGVNTDRKAQIDGLYSSANFNCWASNLVEHEPGWISNRSELWTGTAGNPIDFVGTTENLMADLFTALRYFGESFDGEALNRTYARNVGNYGRCKPQWDALTEANVMKSENKIIQRFY